MKGRLVSELSDAIIITQNGCFHIFPHPLPIFLCLMNHHAAQSQKGNQVWQSHQRIEDIRNGPYGFYRHKRADKDGQYIEAAVTHDRSAAAGRKIFQTPFPIVIPSDNGCKCKENQADHQQK